MVPYLVLVKLYVQFPCVSEDGHSTQPLCDCMQGSGKTLAFGLPILQRLMLMKAESPEVKTKLKALILTPTRELALQVTMGPFIRFQLVNMPTKFLHSAGKQATRPNSVGFGFKTSSAVLSGAAALPPLACRVPASALCLLQSCIPSMIPACAQQYLHSVAQHLPHTPVTCAAVRQCRFTTSCLVLFSPLFKQNHDSVYARLTI